MRALGTIPRRPRSEPMPVLSLDREVSSGKPAYVSGWLSSRRRISLTSTVLMGCYLIPAPPSHAQDLGEAARQEHTRKENHGKRSKHVYTEEDLKRRNILTPEDRARFEARRNTPDPLNAQKSAPAPSDSSQPSQPSLGEVARQNRRQKQERQAQEAAKLPYAMSTAPLATPAAPTRPLAPPPPVRIAPKPRNPFRAMQPVPRPTSPGLAAVVLQRGDSLWKLAERNLGQGARWRELLSLNPSIVDPDRVTAGSRIYVPLQAPAPRRPLRIRIQKGDTLWQIAQTQYGRGTAWRCIALANPWIGDPNFIREGQELLLPATCIP